MEAKRFFANAGDNLSRYIREIHTFPVLSAEIEQALCHRWRDRHDISAAHQLIGSHLRLVVKIARGYRGYGLPSEDLIAEGQLGLMRALRRFDPDRGVRFSTCAILWIRAAIRDYILDNWSLVRIGKGAVQKKLFFNLRRTRQQMQISDDRVLTAEHVNSIAKILQVPEHEVISVDQRMLGFDRSLNAPIGVDGDGEFQELLGDDGDDQEAVLSEREETEYRKSLLKFALKELAVRELHIITERYLGERPTSLRDLARHYGVSKERIRQIEVRAITKLQRSLRASYPESPKIEIVKHEPQGTD
jgi:RNA polymerase sigma-32 factor